MTKLGIFAATILAAAGACCGVEARAAGAKTCTGLWDFIETDCQLTWYGITLYGVIDAGFTYQTHGAPQYPKLSNFGSRGKMDKCTYCDGGGGTEVPGSIEEYNKYGANRMLQGKLPLCAEMCSTKSLLAGDGEIIAQIYKERVIKRGYGSGSWGWLTAYHEGIAV